MRLMDAVAPKRVTIGASAPAPWTIDVDALGHACERLGLERPVTIHVTRGRGGRSKRGIHRDVANAHVISVVNYVSAERASRTLWHELEHACQLERAATPAAFHAAYDRESRAVGYERNPYEAAARHAERRHVTWFALVSA